MRATILSSWRRCQTAGLPADRFDLPFDQDLDQNSRLLRTAAPVLDWLETVVAETQATVILTDGQGWILHRRAGEARLNTSLDKVFLAPGFRWAEQTAGTNGIGTALQERRLCFVLGSEHFASSLQPFACAAAPIRDPLSGRIDGIIDLTCFYEDAKPLLATLAREAAAAIEQRLLQQATERERALLGAMRQSGPGPASAPAMSSLLADDVLDHQDLLILREKATELLASGRESIVEVVLPRGRRVTLLKRAVIGSAGEAGFAVEAGIIEGAEPRRLILPPTLQNSQAEPPAKPSAPPSQAFPVPPRGALASAFSQAPEPDSMERWLLLVGERGVGRLAVAARRRLMLLFEAGSRIGTTLDVARTAADLADVAVPRFADVATVDIPDSVLRGEEGVRAGLELRRTAARTARVGLRLRYPVDHLVEFASATPQARCLQSGEPVLEATLPAGDAAAGGAAAASPNDSVVRGQRAHSLIAVPLRVRDTTLGVASFYRIEEPTPFEEDDLALAQELARRTALCIDNARHYTSEHTRALALQRSMLPHGLPDQNAVEVAHRYLPAHAGVGGDWFDVIPLSGARVALVVGDVAGHGLDAAATMGRIRIAVHNFSALDMPVDELLTHLDDLVVRLDQDEAAETGRHGMIGATLLYAVYDPVTRHCTMARAGHPLPALVYPDGSVDFPELPAAPPLGVGGLPFETADLEIPEGSQLVLYTDGLIEGRDREIETGLERLRRTLARRGRTPEETCEAVMAALLPVVPEDDVALLVARTRALDNRQVANWQLPADPAIVSQMRSAVGEQLLTWGLDDTAETTELLVSEMITNAIRHAHEPIEVRLMLDRTLICEVSDGSSTSPRLRLAGITDEGGRGLFLIAQLAQRWGTRYTTSGKVIWTEQTLPSAADPGAARGGGPWHDPPGDSVPRASNIVGLAYLR